jgi:uncharacterized protein (DUF1501 family)
MSPLLGIWQAEGLAIVHGAGSPDPTRSHFDAMVVLPSRNDC